LKVTRVGAQGELNDLVKARTELECVVADLNAASDRTGSTLADLQQELVDIQGQIGDKEIELNDLAPQWDDIRARSTKLKHQLDESRGHLEALYSKQGRLQRFHTKTERDAFLTGEIASLDKYRTSQTEALRSAKSDLQAAKDRLERAEESRVAARERAEGARTQINALVASIATEKDAQEDMKERRKGLWREDTKLDSLISRATEELRTAERSLASMMDKVGPLMLV
jgi:structural maintenance of chromosome 3 (chondroitin sulfate proteoglycan 6)